MPKGNISIEVVKGSLKLKQYLMILVKAAAMTAGLVWSFHKPALP